MKKLIITCAIIFYSLFSQAQKGLTASLGYAIKGAFIMDFGYTAGKNLFFINCDLYKSGYIGPRIDDQSPNYGLSKSGEGDYTQSYGLGYGRSIKEKILLSGQISFGSKGHYINYIDNRFSEDGYHMVTSSKSIFGAGITGTYLFNQWFGVSAGYNTISQVRIALFFRLIWG